MQLIVRQLFKIITQLLNYLISLVAMVEEGVMMILEHLEMIHQTQSKKTNCKHTKMPEQETEELKNTQTI